MRSLVPAFALLTDWRTPFSLLSALRKSFKMEKKPPEVLSMDHSELPAPESPSGSEGANLRLPEVNVAQSASTAGASGNRADDKDRAGGCKTQVRELTETLKKQVEILDTMKEQQEDRQSGRAFQAATVETLQRVGDYMAEAVKTKNKTEDGKMVLSSMRTVRITEKLGTEVIKDAVKYRVWRQKFFVWMQSQAAVLNMDINLSSRS